MRTERLKKGQKADIDLHNIQWTLTEWQNFCDKWQCGLIIEGGKVVGFITEPIEYRV